MTEAKDYSPLLEGPKGEVWADWLVPDREEWDKITNPSLKTEVRLLARRPQSMISLEKLEETYDRIDELLREDKISDTEAAVWQTRIAKRHEELFQQQRGTKAVEEVGSELVTTKVLEKIANRLDPKVLKSLFQLDYGKLTEAMGILPPGEQIRIYREAERHMVPFEIKVGNEPKFFPSIPKEEQERWKARSTLLMAVAAKESASSSDDLFPNDGAIKLTKNELRTLIGKETRTGGGKRGALQALSLYTLMIYENQNPNDILLRGMDKDKKQNYQTLDSFFKIQDEIEFGKLRDTMCFYLEEHLGLGKEEAQDAEQIAWNLLYLSNLVEECDSRFNQRARKPLPSKRIPAAVSQQYSPVVRNMQHPQERLENKLKAGKAGPVTRESWSVFGEWALNNLRKHKLDPRKRDILPKNLFRNAFEYIDCKVGNRETNLLELLIDNGRKLIKNPNAEICEPDWKDLSNTPFAPYFFDKISPAIKVFKVIEKGEWEGPLDQLGNACRKLGLAKRYREKLLMAIEGVDADSKELKTIGFSSLKWKAYLSGIKKYAPNFFN